MHHIFINENCIDIKSAKIEVFKESDEENFNHLVKVLRIEKGEYVLCSIVPFNFTFDYKVKVSQVTNDKIEMNIEEKTISKELPVKINLYQGLPKADKLEFIIEKAVELGVFSIIPVENEFSISKIDNKKIISKLERFNKISKSAAEQSKRGIIPEVKMPIRYEDMIKKLERSRSILFYENENGIDKTREFIKNIKQEISNFENLENEKFELNIIIGPEGGFSNKEIDKARKADINILSLGERILRTETAAVTALSILMYELQ